MKDKGPVAPSPALISALTKLLRPLVRFLIAQNVTFPILSRLLKGIYVDIADEYFPIPGKEQTDSRITLITGVHRKDVRLLRHEQRDDQADLEQVTLGAQLVTLWTGDPRFHDQAGVPLLLPRFAGDGEGESFESLVREINKDIRPRVVLDEWLRLGVAVLTDDKKVKLNTTAFVPAKGFEEKMHFFGQNLTDHISASAANLSGQEPPFFERSVFSSDLTPVGAETIEAIAKDKAQELLVSLGKEALIQERKQTPESHERTRMAVGVYVYRELVPDEEGNDLEKDQGQGSG